MDETDRQRRYREEARVLGEIGEVLARVDLPRITVRLPSALAQAALEAWQDDDEGEPDPENYEQRAIRHRAATLALIGLAVEQTGREDGDAVVVELTRTRSATPSTPRTISRVNRGHSGTLAQRSRLTPGRAQAL